MIQFFRKIIKACSNQTKISEIKRNVQNGLFFVVGKRSSVPRQSQQDLGHRQIRIFG